MAGAAIDRAVIVVAATDWSLGAARARLYRCGCHSNHGHGLSFPDRITRAVAFCRLNQAARCGRLIQPDAHSRLPSSRSEAASSGQTHQLPWPEIRLLSF